jgi:hypothetical protein
MRTVSTCNVCGSKTALVAHRLCATCYQRGHRKRWALSPHVLDQREHHEGFAMVTFESTDHRTSGTAIMTGSWQTRDALARIAGMAPAGTYTIRIVGKPRVRIEVKMELRVVEP